MDTFLTITQILETLKKNKITPNKQLGQNFLIDKNIRDKIISFAEIEKQDIVIEIGCGLGALTGILAEKADFVYAFEKDRKLASILRNKIEGLSNIKIEEKDFLEVEEKYFSSLKTRVKIIGNLPYYIASPILFKLLKLRKYIKLAVVMVPEDVATRIVAKTGDKNFGVMAVLFSLFSNCFIVYRVSRTVFYPTPEIRSVIMKIIPVEKFESEITQDIFWKTLEKLFIQKRKNILNVISKSFKIDKNTAQSILEQAKITPTLRSHQLEIDQIVRLVHLMSKAKLKNFDLTFKRKKI
ncbi:MAG: 16S rRNA (adenine(1518)-N(6)/adenine(1519)-N(6))-dimethyltransferase RsmA [Candidatus Omnitrophica bacterium]|nr:16S rRNA (adenine(1518)-N(6)/adenine(1519)-N(6))-dimethyltransferase RsmA [Candidatus Omnitrophota bacterium]